MQIAALMARSILFYLGYISVTAVWGTWTAVTGWLIPQQWRHRYVIRTWSQFMVWWLRITCGIFAHVTGREHLEKGPCLLFVKHQSTFDALFTQTLISPQAIVIKRSLLWIPAFGWAFLPTRPIAINRSKQRAALRKVVKVGSQRLANGYWVTIFPEGSRIRPGEVGPLKPGGAILASRTGVRIIVVALNAGRLWPVNKFLKHPGKVEVVISPPIDTIGKKPKEINQLAESWLRSTMSEIDPPVQV